MEAAVDNLNAKLRVRRIKNAESVRREGNPPGGRRRGRFGHATVHTKSVQGGSPSRFPAANLLLLLQVKALA